MEAKRDELQGWTRTTSVRQAELCRHVDIAVPIDIASAPDRLDVELRTIELPGSATDHPGVS